MAIHYRFGSEKQFKSVLVEGAFITVASLKSTLRDLANHDFTRSRDRRFTDDLSVADAQTGQKFSDDTALIPRNASVLIRRLPSSRPTVLPIVVGTSPNPNGASQKSEIDSPSGIDDFGPGIYSTPSTLPVKESPAVNLAEEDSKIKPSVKTLTTLPQGHVCHRCNVAGHFIKDCPTKADPSYPYKRPTSDDSAFDKEVEGLPSMRCSGASDHLIPPELCCPLCKQVMKDAVFAKKCCFKSFCYTCIRDHYIASKFVCVCGAGGVLVDDLLPNMTLRETISRILESDSSSSSGNAVTSRYRAPTTMSTMQQVQDTKKRAASNGLPTDDLPVKKASQECPQKPKKQPVHVPEQQQQQQEQVQQRSRKRSTASNGVQASNLRQKRARNKYNVPAGEEISQVPFASYQHYWYGQPYINGMSYGMAAASSYQLYWGNWPNRPKTFYVFEF